MSKKNSSWPPPQRAVRRHDAKAYKSRQGQRYNSKPSGGCFRQLGVLGAIVAALVAMMRRGA